MESKVNTDIIPQTGVNILWWDYSESLCNWSYTNSCGNFWRLYWNPKPGADIELDGHTYPLGPSEVIVIPPLCSFSTRSEGSFSHLAIHFLAPEFLNRIQRRIFCFPTSQPDFAVLPNLLSQLQAKGLHSELKMMALYELIFRVIRQFKETDLTQTAPHVPNLRIQKIAEQLCLHPEATPQNRELAQSCHMALNTFLRLFKQEYGMSPQRYARIMRIELARTMIWREEYSLEEIARATGFSDRYHFSKVFKLITHCTPAQYRSFHTLTSLVSGASLNT